MSAICGLLQLDGRPLSRDAIAAMSTALAHRGLDGAGTWSDDRIGLAHRMLHTTPESVKEHQPIVLPAQELVLVADARIDNRDDLIRQLRIPRESAPTDGEIILSAYEKWGRSCAERLIGDFAFAIWNMREQVLFCARDPMGVKPFYYVHTERLFAFGSELKALFAVRGIERRLDPEQVALFLGWSQDDRSRTIFQNAMRLPAGHTMEVARGRASLTRYWHPESASDVRYSSDADYIQAFREVFGAAVSARLRSAHPIGATLSGGLDSSSIVCLSRMQRASTAPLHTFSLVFSDLPPNEMQLIDERAYVEDVLRGGGLEPHFVRGDQLSPLGDVQRVLWHLDEPHAAPNLYLHWGMFGAARQSGVRVLLDGFDGDSAVSHGFGRLTSLARAGDYQTLESEIRSFGMHHRKSPERALREYVLPHLAELARSGRFLSWASTATRLSRQFLLSRRELAKRYALRPLIPASIVGFSRAVRDRDLPIGPMLRPPLARTLRRHTRRSAIAELRRPLAAERDAHLQGITQPQYQLTLEIADKSAAAFGIEPRYPFFDRRLIEFCLGLPEEQKFADGWPRIILRRAMDGILPESVQWRSSKANLSPNFHRTFRAVDLAAHKSFEAGTLSPYLRTESLCELDARFRRSATPERMTREALVLFRAAVLQEWLDGGDRERTHNADPEPVLSSPAAA